MLCVAPKINNDLFNTFDKYFYYNNILSNGRMNQFDFMEDVI